MKIFVISDTHGKLDKVFSIYPRLHDIDLLVHLGDLKSDAKLLERELGLDVIGVSGNMDGGYGEDAHRILETEFGRILLTHGHLEHVKQGLQSLSYRTAELECKAVLFGHTHKPLYLEENGVHFLNPGSLSLPAGGGQGSYAIVNTSASAFSASIVYYTDLLAETEKPAKPKVQGGYLKSLLNYSDRF